MHLNFKTINYYRNSPNAYLAQYVMGGQSVKYFTDLASPKPLTRHACILRVKLAF